MNLIAWLKNKYYSKKVKTLITHKDSLIASERNIRIMIEYGGIEAKDWLMAINHYQGHLIIELY